MPDITNQQAVRFCNEKARRLADQIEATIRTCDQFMLDVARDFEEVPEVGVDGQGAANSDVVADGSAADGRKSITKGDILTMKYWVDQLRTFATQEVRDAIHNVSVNSNPLF